MKKERDNKVVKEDSGHGQGTIEVLDNELRRYKKSASDLKWALAILVSVFSIMVAIFVFFIGYLLFRDRRDYRESVKAARDAMKETQEIASKAMQLGYEADRQLAEMEDKLSEKLNTIKETIDNKVADQLRDISEQGEGLLKEMSEQGEGVLKEISASGANLLAYGSKLFKSTDLWAKGRGALNEKKYKRSAEYWEEATKIDPNDVGAFHNWGVALSGIANARDGEEADAYFSEACEKYRVALKIDPNLEDTLRVWGETLVEQGAKKTGKEADVLMAAASEKFERALTVKPKHHRTLISWGQMLVRCAETEEGESDRLFGQACGKFSEALRTGEDEELALLWIGHTYGVHAERKDGFEAEDLWVEAGSKYRAVLALNGKNYDALVGLAQALIGQMETAEEEEADRLLAQVRDICIAAYANDPERSKAFRAWGTALSQLALRKMGRRSKKSLDAFIEEAIEKYELAAVRNADSVVFMNWGQTLAEKASGDVMILGKTVLAGNLERKRKLYAKALEKFEIAAALDPKSIGPWIGCSDKLLLLAVLNKKDRSALLGQAREKALIAESITRGSAAAILAGVCAWEGDEAGCRRWLETGEEAGTLPTWNAARKLTALHLVRNRKWFRKIRWKDER